MASRQAQYARFSLFYLAGYLFPGGVGLMVLPDQATRILGSTGEYGTVFPRMVGLLLFGLGIIVVQLIRYRAQDLYPTTVAVRSVFLAGLAWLYWMSRDRFFLAVFGIVALGVILTSTGLVVDRFYPRHRQARKKR